MGRTWLLYPLNYEEACKAIEKLSMENKRLKRRIEELEAPRKSTRRGRRSIINDEMIQKARHLRDDEGFPMREIAFELGISVYTAHKILHMSVPPSDSEGSVL